ncbi:MAG TPA: hypothetical protein VNA69_10660 [Thermoanaerobaculia bacterium]|nr:hypothetical protein [Thermoanaerobaculia bacterium]
MATKRTAKKASAKKAGAKKAPSKKGITIRCQNWRAVLDTMPPGTPTLTVTGVCYTPTPGYRIKLVPAIPQGINPLILILKKVVAKLPGVWPQKVTKHDVRYTKKTKTKYTNVTILPDGKTIKVQIVS